MAKDEQDYLDWLEREGFDIDELITSDDIYNYIENTWSGRNLTETQRITEDFVSRNYSIRQRNAMADVIERKIQDQISTDYVRPLSDVGIQAVQRSTANRVWFQLRDMATGQFVSKLAARLRLGR